MKLKLNKIKPDPNQPRKTKEDIEGLAETIKREGMLNPILVDSNYMILDGERRYLASKMIGLKEVPVIVLDIDPSDKKRRLIWQAITDVQHKRIPILERDQAWLRLWKVSGKPSTIKMADMLGVSRETVGDALERARFGSSRESLPTALPSDITKTAFLKDKPELRKKVIAKLSKSKAGTSTIKDVTLSRIRKAKSDKDIQAILDEPDTDYSAQADKVISAIKIVLKYLTVDLIGRIPPTQGFLLSGYIDELAKHLRTFEAQEGEIVK